MKKAAVALLFVFGVAAGIYGLAWYHRLRSLPELPRPLLENFPPAVKADVQRAYDAARSHPHDAAANGEFGMVLQAHMQNQAAEACYGRAHVLQPGAFQWLYYLAVVQADQGKNDAAVASLREALHINAQYLPARLRLAATLLASGKTAEAAEVYQSILDDHVDSAEAHYGMGRVQAARGDWAAAAGSYRRACDLYPRYGAAHYGLGLAYRNLGNAAGSREQLAIYETEKNSVPLDNDDLLNAVQRLHISAPALLRDAIGLEHAGRLEEAALMQERALQLEPALVQAHINLISLYARLGQTEKAESHYREAIRLNPNQAQAYYDYGVLAAGLGRNADAEQAFRKALAINPLHPEAHNNLGYLLERRGRFDDAVRQYRQALENQPDYRLAHFHLGRILVNRGRYQEGVEHLLKTIAIDDGDTPRYLYALGSAYGRSGNREAALRYDRMARDRAAALGQKELVSDIERDLHVLEATGGSR